MVPKPIDPVGLRLAQLLDDDKLSTSKVIDKSLVNPEGLKVSPFEDVLSKAVEKLGAVSKQEIRTNNLISSYLKGEVELADVMLETSKLSVMVQLAVTTVNTAVTTFKEITQMQV